MRVEFFLLIDLPLWEYRLLGALCEPDPEAGFNWDQAPVLSGDITGTEFP